MSSNDIETNDVNESQSKGLHLTGVHDRGTLVVIIRILPLVREGTGLAKRMRSLWSAIY